MTASGSYDVDQVGEALGPCLGCGHNEHRPWATCAAPGCACVYRRDEESPQAVTYLEAVLEGANPDEGFYE